MRTTRPLVLAILAFTAASAAHAASATIERADRTAARTIGQELGVAARQARVAIVPDTLSRSAAPGALRTSVATAAGRQFSRDDLARGRAMSFSYLRADDIGIAGDFYIEKITLDDPASAESRLTGELLDRGGNVVAAGAGTFQSFGTLPPPGEVAEMDCTTSGGWGTDSEGNLCYNIVEVCVDDNGDVGVMMWCLTPVE